MVDASWARVPDMLLAVLGVRLVMEFDENVILMVQVVRAFLV